MAIKPTVLGLLIYLAMGTYLLALFVCLAGRRRMGMRLYGAGFLAAVCAVALRWRQAGHVPMRNLFDVFLCVGATMWPLSLFCRRCMNIGDQKWDALIAAVVLFPAGFVFGAEHRGLMPELHSPLFAPHVACYVLGYAILAKAAVQAVAQLASPPGRGLPREADTCRLVGLAFPPMTVGLALGVVWAEQAWADFWGWDPKEMWALASWLSFVGYLHFRATFGRRLPRVNAAIFLAGFVVVVLTLLWASLSARFAGMHSYAT